MRLGHEIVLDVCVRLLRGEVIEVADQSGRNWRATMDSLSLVFRGEPCPVLENAHAFEVAVFLLARVAHTSR